MADIAETAYTMLPSSDRVNLIFFTGTKAAQNDTVTFSDYRIIYGAVVFVDDASTWEIDVVSRVDATENQITLTGADTGTVWGIAWGIK